MIQLPNNDPNSFRHFEHQGWERSTIDYDHYFSPLTTAIGDEFLALLSVQPGDKVIDLACGPGYVANKLNQHYECDVDAVDFSAAMIAIASSQYPHIRFHEQDVEALQFADQSFDCACMNFGILHLAKPEKAIDEAYRVLKKHGRFAFSIWNGPDISIGFKIILDALHQHKDYHGTMPKGPPFFHFSERNHSIAALKQAGFVNIHHHEVKQIWHFQHPEELYLAFFNGTARTGGELRLQTPKAQAAIKQAVITSMAPFRIQSADSPQLGYQVPMSALIFIGEKA